jgi:hypothetical protein
MNRIYMNDMSFVLEEQFTRDRVYFDDCKTWMVTQDNVACTRTLVSVRVDDVVNLETLQSEMAAKVTSPCPDSNWFHLLRQGP